MKKIYIHIGCHKTGSTSLQHFFYKNKSIFLKNNIYIQKEKNPFDYTINHSNIAWEIINDDKFDRTSKKKYFIRFIFEIKKQKENILISSENFSHLIHSPKKIKKFIKILRKNKFEPIFICYIRNDSTYAYSLYSELRKNRKKLKLENVFLYTKQILRNGYYATKVSYWGTWIFYFNYKKFIKLWKTYTKCKIIIIDYSKNKKNIFIPLIKYLKIDNYVKQLKYPTMFFNATNNKIWHLHKLFYRIYFYFLGKKIYNKYKY